MTLRKLICIAGSLFLASTVPVTTIANNKTSPSPGFFGEYHKGNNFNYLVHSRVDSDINFNWSAGNPIKGVPANNFSVRWSGLFTAPHRSGTRQYRFTTTTDDGVRLHIGNQAVINQWKRQGKQHHSHAVSLRAGQRVPVIMEYYDNEGSAFAYLTITDLANGTDISISKTVVTPDSQPPALLVSKASDKSISLSWTAPLTRMDGTSIALSEIDHYRILYGNSAKKLGKIHRIDSDQDSYTFQNLPKGRWYFAITVVDQSGRESSPSAIVSKSLE
ncbi:MAG: PA14 domain-containing protein [Marinobacter sp.]|uniref:PA14 domain-containing protein n=1 Tax=Marinobacter sp. TaxID=50741 RepID=UPI003297C15F